MNCPSEALAHQIASSAVTARLAACANIEGPIASVYHWEGKIERGEEYVLWLKTQASLWSDLESFVAALHPDDTPAILAIPCVSANARYEAWLLANSKAS